MALEQQIDRVRSKLDGAAFTRHFGYIKSVRSPTATIVHSELSMGQICLIFPRTGAPQKAEVIGLNADSVIVMPFGSLAGLAIGDKVSADMDLFTFNFSNNLLGKVVDGFGRVMTETLSETEGHLRAAKQTSPPPLSRPLIDTPLRTGLRVIDGFLTLGRGQRIAIMGSAGTGKTSLLAQIAKEANVDVTVIALVGERGREVGEFLGRYLTEDVRTKMVVVAATSDTSSSERFYAPHVATSIAEGFRDQGKSVLLIMDSMTRVARAVREVGLSVGEMPTRRGFPPSVFTALPEIVERSGRTDVGDITAIYSVLVEGEIDDDPIAEEMRSLVDGHIILSRDLASKTHYPAIDISHSLSRLMSSIVTKEHTDAANQLRGYVKDYKEVELLIQIGEYKHGSDAKMDKAIAAKPLIDTFLKQSSAEDYTWKNLQAMLQKLAK